MILSGINHIAIIMDGNRRFAKRLMAEPWRGHELGAGKVKEVLEWCKEAGIKYITLYTLSMQNLFSRPKQELDFILNKIKEEFSAILNDPFSDVHKYKIRVNVFGRIYLLPEDVQAVIKNVMDATKDYSDYMISFAIAYGGQEEIVDAVRSIAEKIRNGTLAPEKINEDVIRHSLYTNGIPYPDIIIRTGGEKRLSNFLLWQCAYSELFFVDKMWPEFSKDDFLAVLEEFKQRERRFGR